ncbi:SH3 and cysteine-rich domain-containing protein 2 isoform X3 [Oncorhynchus tshawytscha]|uniref:SH3 and cysteine-rich domain-containing protein 2 isoform X3 n=1 Tax=Oncorhynchus tshawytscha TaxID=74940 RepID=UPI001C3CA0CF|nr:SH3 and cysteine-rich domain-containing protein 2 isoform X3 [Oncorhynchus tshawytscha]
MTENNEKENEPQHRDLHRCPSTVPIQPESKLQRLKRSLSFKSVMRSKSVDNFFQRPSNGEVRLPSGIIHEPPLTSSPPPFGETPLTCERSPSLSPSLSPNPSLSSHSPSLSPSLSLTSKAQLQGRLVKTHFFQEHVFRRPTCCQQCKHVIQGNSKQGLRCKACKLGAHLWCSSELSQQPCTGKTGAFKRNFSSPLLTNDMLGVVKEAPPSQESDKGGVDPVYEALRYGTSLAQMSRSSFGSITESPIHKVERVGEGLETQPIVEEEFVPETETLNPPESEADSEDRVSLKAMDEACNDIKTRPEVCQAWISPGACTMRIFTAISMRTYGQMLKTGWTQTSAC